MSDYRNDEDFKPFTELLAGVPYEIFDSRGMPGLPSTGVTNKADREMYVPFEPSGRTVSQHEHGHVLWSPTTVNIKKLGLPIMVMQAVEDGRVNLGLAHLGLGLVFDDAICDEVVRLAAQDLSRAQFGALVLRLVASFGTNVRPALLALVAGTEPAALQAVRELDTAAHVRFRRARWRAGGPVATFMQGVRIARWLTRELDKYGFEPPTGGALVACGHGLATKGGRSPGRPCHLEDGVLPGRLRIATPPLLHRCTNATRGLTRRTRLATEGTLLRSLDRFFTDQRVFARPARKITTGGGSVLIDVSGSMSLSADDVEQIIAAAPDATLVAIYSGRRDHGELRVVVKNGYRAAPADLAPYGSGNIVDLPALQWLAKQHGPRIWISDGKVTGRDDTPTTAITTRCKQICKEAGIIRVGDAGEAAKALAKAA